MKLVPEAIADNLPLVILFLFCVVFCRAQGTYWLGYAAATGALWGKDTGGIRGAIGSWFNGPIPKRGVAILERWGLIIIPLCFLTVGLQTAVNAGAGVVRMRWVQYTLAMTPGCIAWAFIYGLTAVAVWEAILNALAGSVWAWLVLFAVIGAVYGLHLLMRRHRRALDEDVPLPEAAA